MAELCRTSCLPLNDFKNGDTNDFERSIIFSIIEKSDNNIIRVCNKIDVDVKMKIMNDIRSFIKDSTCFLDDYKNITYSESQFSKDFEKSELFDGLVKDNKNLIDSVVKNQLPMTGVVNEILSSPDFVFPEFPFKLYLEQEEFVPVMLEDVRKYLKAVQQTYFDALLKVQEISDKKIAKSPGKKFNTEDISLMYNCIQHLFWPRMLKSLQNILDNLLMYVRISGKAYLKDKCVLLIPNEKGLFDNLAQLIKVYEDETLILDDILVFHKKVNIPQYDHSIEVHNYLTMLLKNIQEDYKAIRDYYNDPIKRCLEQLDTKKISELMNEESQQLDVSKLTDLADQFGSCDEFILDTIPQHYYYKVYKFDSTELIKALLRLSREAKNKVSNYLKKCAETDLIRFEWLLEEYEETAKRSVETGKELALVHKTVIDITTNGLDEMIQGLKDVYRVIFAAMNCNPEFSPIMERASNLFTSMGLLKEACTDACNNLEALKFKFEEDVLEIPRELQIEMDEYDKYHIHAFSEVKRYDKIEQVAQYMIKIKKWLNDKYETVEFVHSEQTALGLPHSVIPNLKELKNFIECFEKLVKYLRNWSVTFFHIKYGPVQRWKLDDLETIIEETYRTLLQYQKYFQGHIKNAVVEHQRFRYDAKYPHSSDSSEGEGDGGKKKKTPPAPLALIQDALEEVRYLKGVLPILGILTNERLSMRHWKLMSELSGKNMVPYLSSSLNDYIDLGIEEFQDQYVYN